MAREKSQSIVSSYDFAEDINVHGNYIWDTGTLAWIKQTAGGGGAGGPATIGDGADVAQGSRADAAWASGSGTVISLLKTIASASGAGGLTDAQLRASAVPVSGAFYQVTQPVSGPLTDAQLRAVPVPVSGTVSVGTVPVTGPLTDTQLRATPVPVSGTVTATGPLTDTQLRASAVPVSGPLTDTQLRATPVPVSGTVTATGPLTDTQLRATPVPVSGTVTATGPLTDTQLRATAVPVSAAALPLPANAAIETGGNLAALVAAIGAASVDNPGNNTLLDRLYQLSKKIDKLSQETTQKQVAAALIRPAYKPYTTLQHR